ncbi:hypothetical protein GCM10010211_02800 [Streptomyces albospinus]|uniref:Secreted protein n=1 Tax=Streptomyces albospinus TaxID=285515 RepID=A0ABQ2UL43_9ACTN|nr:hypothetical protein [Streptomyces albospinus]GGU42979.1 hypothetical protein GCM10010211_02800 [Streptomyces albospinus]
MTALTTPVKLGGYALILLAVLAAGFGLGRAVAPGGRDAPAHVPPAQHTRTVDHSQHTKEQS